MRGSFDNKFQISLKVSDVSSRFSELSVEQYVKCFTTLSVSSSLPLIAIDFFSCNTACV